jgi:hypothetical protein
MQYERGRERVRPRKLKTSGSISRISRDVLAEDERVDVVRSFVGFYRFQIHHVAHDGVVLSDAVGAEDIASHTRAFERHPHVIPFGHRNMLMADGARIFQAADVQGK